MSAKNANLNVLVTPSIFTQEEDFSPADVVVSDLGELKNPFKVIKGEVYGYKIVNIKLLESVLKI